MVCGVSLNEIMRETFVEFEGRFSNLLFDERIVKVREQPIDDTMSS